MISKKNSPYYLILVSIVFMFAGKIIYKPALSKTPHSKASLNQKPLVLNDSVTPHPAHSYLSNLKSNTTGDSLISYAKNFLGVPYVYGASGARSFDCSGFTSYIFQKFNIQIPHSSALQANQGKKITKTKAQRGDLIVFTGTNATIRKPGHVGIVISKPGKPIRFVHASSVGGVKISELEGTRYATRFLEIRRLL